MTTKTAKPEADLVTLARAVQAQVEAYTLFTEAEATALNELKTAIFVNLTQKNLEDFGISRPGR